jgi:mono/diheme cytochrome c family protein
MRRIIVLVTFTCLLRIHAAPAPQAAAAPPGDAANGKSLYVSRACYQCHNTLAQGGAGPRLAPNPITYPAFVKELRQPRDEMPPYRVKVISDKEIADIYAYLRTIPPPPAPNTIPMLNR